MSLYTFYKAEPFTLSFTHSETAEEIAGIYFIKIRDIINDLRFKDDEMAKVIESDFEEYENNREKIRLMSKSQDDKASILNLRLDNYLLFNSLIKKHNIEIDLAEEDSINYSIYRTAYSIKNDVPENSLSELGGRIYFFGVDYVFGIISFCVIIFLLYNIFTIEFEEDTILLLKTLPYKFSKIIFSKLICALLILLTYLIMAFLCLSITILIKEKSLSSLLYIFRVLDGGYNYFYLWEYFLLCGGLFILVVLAFMSFVFFISLKTRDSQKTLIIISILVIGFYVLEKSTLLDKFINPLDLLNYRKYVIGAFSTKSSGLASFVKQRENPVGLVYYGYLVFIIFINIILTLYFSFKEMHLNKKSIKDMKNNCLLAYELKKITRSYSYFELIFVIFIIVLISHISMENLDNVNIKNRLYTFSKIKILEEVVSSDNKKIEELEQFKEKLTDKDELDEVDEKIEHYKKENIQLLKKKKLYSIEKNAFEENNRDVFNKNIFKLYSERIPPDFSGEGFEFNPKKPSNLSEFSKVISYEYIKEINKRKIRPILGQDFLISKYDVPINSYIKDYYEKTSTPYTHDGLYSIYRGNNQYGLSFVIMILSFLYLSGGYTLDKEFNNNINLLYSQPVKRQVYQDKKYILYISGAFIITITFELIWILIGTIMDGFGQLNYPIVYYDRISDFIYKTGADFNGYFSFIDIKDYILRNTIMIIFNMIFILSLYNLISIFVNKKSKVIGWTILFYILGLSITRKISSELVMSLSPFAYINTASVADGSIRVVMNNDKISLISGVISCSIFTIINYIVESIIIEKIDIKL